MLTFKTQLLIAEYIRDRGITEVHGFLNEVVGDIRQGVSDSKLMYDAFFQDTMTRNLVLVSCNLAKHGRADEMIDNIKHLMLRFV